MSDSPPVVRENGRFTKGHSGNPAGRPPNTKNKIANLADDLRLAVLEHVSAEKVKRIVNKIVEKAEGGDVRAAKLILDKLIPNATPGDEASDNGRTVVFRIENATFAAQQQLERHSNTNAIDVQVTDVTHEKVVNEQ